MNLSRQEQEAAIEQFVDQVRDAVMFDEQLHSCVLFSGRGLWLFWRLDECVQPDEVEDLNRRLETKITGLLAEAGVAADVDACSNCDRLSRWPGSINQKTGLQAKWLETNDSEYDFMKLRQFCAPTFVFTKT